MSRVEQQQQAEIEGLIGNKYRILCRIGGGGMAQVLLARHRLHGGLFAVKILAEHLASDPSIVARFKQEATTAASLSGHPNIATIFDIGEGHGLHYLVMQFVCGEDLAGYLRREGKLSPAAAAGVIAQVGEALCCAESKRVVHRDLKPANILLDTSGRIKILDFGISKITDIADGLTRPGESLGTPFYMSPEQIRAERCDVRSDLYSLGVVFFELLTGRRPFENESITGIQYAHVHKAAPLLLEVDPTLPPACEQIVQRLLRKEPGERYQTAQALLDDLYANGASSGPTTLRPVIPPWLQKEIDDAPEANESVATEVCSNSPVDHGGVGSGRSQAQTPAPAGSTETQAGGVQAGEARSSETQSAKPRSARLVPIAFVSAAFLLVAIIGLLFFVRGKQSDADLVDKSGASRGSKDAKGTNTNRLDAVVEDAHGRMVLVPGGEFIFGDSTTNSHPRQIVNLPAFYIDATEVSNAEYLRFTEATGHALVNAAEAKAHPRDPVTGISQADAQAYGAWASKRLPTEEEWEKAARGADGRPYPWGEEAWTRNVPEQLQPVDSFPERRSPYGAYNMAGNAWEWTAGRASPGERELADMRQLLKSDNFSRSWFYIKGGSFSPNGSAGFRVYLRRGFPEDQHSAVIGFRCAKDAVSN